MSPEFSETTTKERWWLFVVGSVVLGLLLGSFCGLAVFESFVDRDRRYRAAHSAEALIDPLVCEYDCPGMTVRSTIGNDHEQNGDAKKTVCTLAFINATLSFRFDERFYVFRANDDLKPWVDENGCPSPSERNRLYLRVYFETPDAPQLLFDDTEKQKWEGYAGWSGLVATFLGINALLILVVAVCVCTNVRALNRVRHIC